MKLDISSSEVQKGLIFKKTYTRVRVVVELTKEETKIVKDNLEALQRMGDIIVNPAEFNCNKIPIRIGHLEFGRQWKEDYDFENTRDANGFVEDLKNQLSALIQGLKEFATSLPESGTFEL